MDLDHAVQAHAEWKLKLRSAISKQESVDAVVISADNRCPLGQWLHGEAKQKLGSMKSHAECIEKHAAFHKEAGKVALAINAHKYADAESMLSTDTPFATASSAATLAIMHLKKESGL
jgi:methyl-accepting chemotaxis protein